MDKAEKLVIFTEVYSRVVGYLRPISAWHPSKVAEFHDRVTFDRAVGETE